MVLTEATWELPCRKCGQWIPMDEGLWAYHVVVVHEAKRGEPLRDIAMWYMNPTERREMEVPSQERK